MSLISRIFGRGHAAAALVAVAALAAACTGSHTTAAFTPTFADPDALPMCRASWS